MPADDDLVQRATTATAVIVLTRNRERELAGVLEVVTTWDDLDAVVVVDNASDDGTAEMVGARYPHVDLVRSDENLGATGGRNLGLVRARELGCTFAFLAEDDTTPNRSAFDACLAQLEGDRRIALAGTHGGIFRYGLVRWGRSRRRDSSGVGDCDFLVLDGCVGRLAALDAVGYLRDDFFIMFEEQELGLRLRDAGWRMVRVDIDVERSHLGAASSGAAYPWRAYYQTRNHLALCRQRRSAALWFGFAARIAHQLVRESLARKRRSLALRWRGVRDAIGGRMGARVVPPAR